MSDPFRIVVFLSGRGSNFSAIADAIAAHALPIAIAGVVSDKAAAGGIAEARSRGINTTIVTRRAKEISEKQFHRELLTAAESYAPDLVVLAGFMRILSDEFADRFAGKIVNIHPSLLPAFKGLRPHAQALAAGAKLTGCSVHYVTNELDGGPIIAQAVVPVHANDDEASLAARVLIEEHKLYPAVIAGIARGQIHLTNKGVHIDPKLCVSNGETTEHSIHYL